MNKKFEKIFIHKKNNNLEFQNSIIPVLDKKKRIIKIKILNKYNLKHDTDTDVLIMAGGFGKRLFNGSKSFITFFLKFQFLGVLNSILVFLQLGHIN